MYTVTDTVREIVKKSPFIQEVLKNDWLNLSQYAASIKPEVESKTWKKVQTGSIITALGRIRAEIQTTFDIQFKIVDISLKLPITEFNFAKTPEHSAKIEQLYKHFATTDNHFLNIISGNTETGIFINSNYDKQVQKIFRPQKPNIHITDLAAVSIKFDQDILGMSGAVYQILKYLVWENINLLEVISTYTELTLIVEKSNANRVLDVLSKELID